MNKKMIRHFNAEGVEDVNVVEKKTTFNLDNAKTNLNKIATITDSTMKFAFVGGIVGLGIALYRRNSYIVSPIIGIVIGGIVANVINNNVQIIKK